MDYLRNHCWCSRSNWDNKVFDCQIIVSISSYNEDEEDWDKLTQEIEIFSQKSYDKEITFAELIAKKYPDEYDNKYLERIKNSKRTGVHKISVFKPEVIKWLEDNVPDIKNEKAWCVGSHDYNIEGSNINLSVFFQRRRDAMLFIKTFSKWGKPVNYCQYFTDVRKKLNLKTLKYEKV